MSDTQIILDAITRQEDKTKEGFVELRSEISKIRETISIFDKKTTELDVHLDEARQDIQKFEKILHGNGAPGLKLQVEMLDKSLEAFKENLKNFNEQQAEEKRRKTQIRLSDDKNRTAIKVALITSLLSFFAIMINLLVNIFN